MSHRFIFTGVRLFLLGAALGLLGAYAKQASHRLIVVPSTARHGSGSRMSGRFARTSAS